MKKTDREESLIRALRLTVEYIGLDMLPAEPGWDWFEALEDEPWFPEWLSAMQGKAGVNVPHHLTAGSLVDCVISVGEYEQQTPFDKPWRIMFVAPAGGAGCYLIRMTETDPDIPEAPLVNEYLIEPDSQTKFLFFYQGHPYIIAGTSTE